MFSVEIYLRLECPNCHQAFKRRFLDYLSSRTSHCHNCNTKVVHLARAQDVKDRSFELTRLSEFINSLEQNWSGLVNESLTVESKDWSQGGPDIQSTDPPRN